MSEQMRIMRSKKLPEELRYRIVARHRSGQGYKKNSAALKVPKSTVASIIQTCQPWNFFLSTTCVMAGGGGVHISYVVYIICSVRITLFMLNISQRSALSHILQLHDSG